MDFQEYAKTYFVTAAFLPKSEIWTRSKLRVLTDDYHVTISGDRNDVRERIEDDLKSADYPSD